tara:strand:+ start:377 stop:595 length:219 start_codon:yes stop_codon:yes gene_type:complete
MKPSMITIMAMPIISAIHMRVWLKKAWSSSHSAEYFSTNMVTMEVAIMAKKVGHMPWPELRCSSVIDSPLVG